MNYHYKNNGFLTPQIASVAQTIVNVMYSDFTKLLKNSNVRLTPTRSTFAHTQKQAQSKRLSLVSVKHTIVAKCYLNQCET